MSTTTIRYASTSRTPYLRGKPASTWIDALSRRGRASKRPLARSEHRS
jgi:hypothetical protein